MISSLSIRHCGESDIVDLGPAPEGPSLSHQAPFLSKSGRGKGWLLSDDDAVSIGRTHGLDRWGSAGGQGDMLHQLLDTLAPYNVRQYAIAYLPELPTTYMGSAIGVQKSPITLFCLASWI